MSLRQSKRPDVSNTRVENQTEQAPTIGCQYISETGGNNAPPTYQDASGAPIENKSPLGYSVGPVTITLLNITMMIGAGIYSTRECDTTNVYPTKSTANMEKHRLSCLARAQSVSVSSTGHLVIWYVLCLIRKDKVTDYVCSVSSYVSRPGLYILNSRRISQVDQVQRSSFSSKHIPIQNGSFLPPLPFRVSFFRLEVPMPQVSLRSYSSWHKAHYQTNVNSHGSVSHRNLRARGYQLANQRHGSSLLQSCYLE